MKRLILPILCLVMSAGGLKAAEPVDSTSLALATIWADYLRPRLTRDYGNNPATLDRYMEGVKDAMTASPAAEPYYRGMLEGLQLAQRIAQMKAMGAKVDPAILVSDLADCLAGKSDAFTVEAADRYLARVIADAQPVDTVSRAAEQAWLDTQFKREGVVKRQDGLMIEVLREGEGTYPTLADSVKLLYTGRLSDGTVFDSTETPVVFTVDNLVPGFTEGLLMMKPGGRYRLFIPSDLGYGPEGVPGAIPGNAALDFTIDLLEVIQSDN